MANTTAGHDSREDAVFTGGGELVARCRDVDWAATPLGPVEGWSPALRCIVRACLESPFAMSVWCGPELVLIYNDAYRRILDIRHPAALGRPGAEVWSEVWPRLEPIFRRVLAGGAPFHAEDERLTLQRPGEEGAEPADAWFTFAVSAVRDEEGRIVAALNVVSETTKWVEAEAEAERLVRALQLERSRLEYVFRQAPAFLAVLRGPEHILELVNDAFYQLVGHRNLVGMPLFDALKEVRDQGFELLIDRVYRTGEPFVGRELPLHLRRVPGAAPEERFVDLTYVPLIEADGVTSGVIAHGTDATEQVLARREVERLLVKSERARADADSANRTKSEFLATMSHEFRTPLNAILGYAQLLDMGVLGPATPAQHAHLERLQASARHLLRLIDDVLDVARMDANRLAVRRDTLVSAMAVVSALALVQPQATAKGIRILDVSADQAGVRYLGDEHRVRQILVNLLSNAVKFTPPGGMITVTCGETTEPGPGALLDDRERGYRALIDGGSPVAVEEGRWACFTVEDTGPGLSPELASRLFEPFVQGDSAFTREKGGTGLGLAISRRLARLMGGDLTVHSRTGGGASFTLWLPVPVSEGDEDDARPTTSPDEQPVRRTPTSVPAVSAGAPGMARLDDAAFAVLHALGVRLAADAETVSDRYVAALRADSRFPGVRELATVQLRDHATPAVGLLATQIMVIGETRGQAPELLGDGGKIQRFMDELHGAQRHRLGWSEADIEREVQLLLTETKRALQTAVDAAAIAGVAAAPSAEEGEISAAAVRAAASYATDLVQHLLEWGMGTALRAYRFARAAEAR